MNFANSPCMLTRTRFKCTNCNVGVCVDLSFRVV